tara:strand:- start:2474 stop:2989 length:516 start_codon:yes stop_codon:yes gene_type:complete
VPICSLQRIEITDEDQDYSAIAPAGDGLFILCDFGDQLENEVSLTPSVTSQNSTAIDSNYTVVRGRGGKVQTLEWSRTLTHASANAARQYLMSHISGLPSKTIGAQITYETDTVDATIRPGLGYYEPGSGFQTYRAQLTAYPGSPASGLDTTVNYTLQWQIGTVADGGPPP